METVVMWLLTWPWGNRKSWEAAWEALHCTGRTMGAQPQPGKRLERKRDTRQRLQEAHGGRNSCYTQNPPSAARIAIKNSHILDGNSHILRELGQTPPPTNISNAKPAVKTDPNYHSFCKKDENCIARSPKFGGAKTIISVHLAGLGPAPPPPRLWGPRTKCLSSPHKTLGCHRAYQSPGAHGILFQLKRPPLLDKCAG